MKNVLKPRAGWLIFLMMPLLAQSQYDTTIVTYNFNNLNAGNLNNQDNWNTSVMGTATDVQVKAAHSHDGSKALYFPQNGAGVNAGVNRKLDSIFPDFDFSDTSAIYYIYVDMKPEWWGSEFGIAFDANNDGVVSAGNNNEKALRISAKTNNSTIDLYKPNGSKNTYMNLAGGWKTFEFKLDMAANSGKGYLRLRYKTPSASTWTNIASKVNLALDFSTTGNRNPSNWNHVFGYFTGTGSGLDNIVMWKLTLIPRFAPTDISITGDTISENQPNNRFIALLSATDPDTVDAHTFSLVPGLGDDDNSMFRISNDSLFSDTTFSYTDTSTRTIRIKATDMYSKSLEKPFIINILEVIPDFTGIIENSSNAINVYPNPTLNGEINIDFGMVLTEGTITLFSVGGRKLDSWNIVDADNIIIQINDQTGIYVLNISTKGENYYFKVLKE